MKRLLIASSLLGLAALPAFADTTETYPFTGYDELDIAAGVEVEFVTSPEYSVVAEFERGGPDDVKVSQKGDRLYIARKATKGWGKKSAIVHFRVTGPNLEAIEASSGSQLVAKDIAASALAVDVSSGAQIDVTGTCDSLDIEVSSGGDADLRDVQCKSVYARASSGGNLEAFASTRATSKTSSGGNVDIWGNPSDREANKSMSGGSTSFRS